MSADVEEGSDGAEQPVERLIYFFLPLPEPLQLPDNYRVETHHLVPFTELRRAGDGLNSLPENWDGQVLAASCRIWQTMAPDRVFPLLQAVSEVVRKALPTLNDHRAEDEEPTPHQLNGHDDVSVTVAEVAVRVDDFDDEDVYDAFEFALECVQAIQRAHTLVSKEPLTPLTVENSPSLVHMAQREVGATDGPEGGWPDGYDLYLTNLNLPPVGSEPSWGPEQLAHFQAALDIHQVAPFAPMAQLAEEGQRALRRRGDYRAAITLLYSASESLLDTLLMHMLWEDNRTPEEAVSECFSKGGLRTRLKSHYAPRLRGNWSLTGKGHLTDWDRSLASVRHRVVHTGYTPSRNEAFDAEAAYLNLQDFIIDRVCSPKFLRRYPVTALSLVSDTQLKAQNRWTSRMERLVNDPTEVNWIGAYGRWRDWLDTLRSEGGPVHVSDDDCVPVLVVAPRADEDTWWTHDTINGLVMQMDSPRDTLTEKGQILRSQQKDARQELLRSARPGDRVSIAWGGEFGKPLPGAQRQPVHQVLPFHGIMRDGSDERAPLPLQPQVATSAPTSDPAHADQ